MSEAYERDSVFVAYLKWHYSRGLKELLGVSQNFMWFVLHFFSFKLLLSTLFSPWKRMGETYGNVLDLGRFASAFIVNSIMRIVGFVSRSIVLVVGLAAMLFVCVLSLLSIMIWVLAPAVLIGSIVLSVTFFSI